MAAEYGIDGFGILTSGKGIMSGCELEYLGTGLSAFKVEDDVWEKSSARNVARAIYMRQFEQERNSPPREQVEAR